MPSRKVATVRKPSSRQTWAARCTSFNTLLITADVYTSSDELVAELPSLRNGRPVFCSVRGRKRLKNSLRFCRSDDSSTTAAISKCRKLTAVRDVWTMFQTNLKNLYKPSAFLTVDEQLVSTRGRSKLRQYMPCEYGIFWSCDAETSYLLAGEIYVGGQPSQDVLMNAANLVKRYPGNN
ncbi:DNA topoisomerase 2-alpha [Trichinella spiralis]|uniref:DNA topoisomerase 2-alpha n=1 Tax=Trichinella spiralis TaxID=6334 RepID=UPI0001EFB29F|nr:DNA topoisomerase 2-alpha [Trichinella spiralis]